MPGEKKPSALQQNSMLETDGTEVVEDELIQHILTGTEVVEDEHHEIIMQQPKEKASSQLDGVLNEQIVQEGSSESSLLEGAFLIKNDEDPHESSLLEQSSKVTRVATGTGVNMIENNDHSSDVSVRTDVSITNSHTSPLGGPSSSSSSSTADVGGEKIQKEETKQDNSIQHLPLPYSDDPLVEDPTDYRI